MNNYFENEKRVTLTQYHSAVKALALTALEGKLVSPSDYGRFVEIADKQIATLSRKSAVSAAKRAEKKAAAGVTPLPASYVQILNALEYLLPVGEENAQTIGELNAASGTNISALNAANAVKRGGEDLGIVKVKRADGKSAYYRLPVTEAADE